MAMEQVAAVAAVTPVAVWWVLDTSLVPPVTLAYLYSPELVERPKMCKRNMQ